MAIEADWTLIQQMVENVTPKSYKQGFDGIRIFRHELGTDIDPNVYEIIDLKADYNTKIEINCFEGELLVYAPNELGRNSNGTKRRKGKQQQVVVPREYLMKIPVSTEIEFDFNLFKECSRLKIQLTDQLGPYLLISPGRITLVFGLFLSSFCPGGVADNAIGQSQTISRVFGRVLNQPALETPQDDHVSISAMFDALTEPKGLSGDLISIPSVLTPLHSFQCQSVRWCLAREGCKLVDDGQVVQDAELHSQLIGWYHVDGYWINPYSVKVQLDTPDPATFPNGGLLAEEMGLGKTLEIIALTQLHKRADQGVKVDERTGELIQMIGATLVIVPSGIIEQWVTELENHAPGLSICTYTGKGAVSPENLAAADIVLASYSVIAAEVHAASFNPGLRNTRFWKDRQDIKSVRSSLVQVEFWRVVLDEAQMIHAGVNNAARVAGLIPRVNSWAVTGTPVKNSIADLRGQLGFLKVEPFSGKRAFERLLAMPQDYKALVQQVGLRHTKYMLRDQLRLPPQNRRLIMLKFNEMERLFYETVREQFVGESTDASLSAWLVRLRQACCIPSSHERNVFIDTTGATLTIEQALLQLTRECENKLVRLSRQWIGLQLELGQLYLIDEEDKIEKAINLWESQLEPLRAEILKNEKIRDDSASEKKALDEKIKEEKNIIDDMTFDLRLLGQKLAGNGFDDENNVNTMEGGDVTDEEKPQIIPNSGPLDGAGPDIIDNVTGMKRAREDDKDLVKRDAKKGTIENIPLNGEIKQENDSNSGPSEIVDVSTNPEFIKKRYEVIDRETALDDLYVQTHTASNVVKSAVIQINACNELLHRAFFFLGTGYFQLGEKEGLNESDKEAYSIKERDFYAKAEDIRSKLLSEEQDAFLSVRDKLKEPTVFVYEEAENIYEQFFDAQADKMMQVQKDLMAILQTDLLEKDTETSLEDQDAYTTSMELQDKGYVYLNCLERLLRDREGVMNGDRNVKTSKKKRKRLDERDEERSESAEKLNKQLNDEIGRIIESVDKHELFEKQRVARANEDRFKKLERDLVRRKAKIQNDIGDDDDFVLEKVEKVRHRNLDKLKSDCRAWKREVGVLTEVFNARLKYFKSLQAISDKVREPQISDVSSAMRRKDSSIVQVESEINDAEARLKFIAQLEVKNPDKHENNQKVHEDECAICQDTYIHGSFTTCGHRCCTVCLQSWLAQNPSCPICKSKLSPNDVFQFKYGEAPEIKEAPRVDDLSNDVYAHISTQKYNEIVSQPIKKSYGVKIDMIVRHILLLKSEQPDVQIVIFTQWARMLHALTHALIQHGIRAMRKAQPKSVPYFRTNKDITCFMLHTSNDSAGLTLTNATHVILCEPLLTTAIELQAISRIHRIGQTHRTTVWLFAIEDTVEQQILALATERRVKVAEQKHLAEETAESEILTSTMGTLVDRSSGSEMIQAADIKRILGIPDSSSS